MRRILLFAAAASLALSACAATRYRVGPVEMTAPVFDDDALVCTDAPILLPVPVDALRVLHLRLVQGAWAFEDSIVCTAGSTATFAAVLVPSGATCDLTAWASDDGGIGCPLLVQSVPVSVRTRPGRPTLR